MKGLLLRETHHVKTLFLFPHQLGGFLFAEKQVYALRIPVHLILLCAP